MALASWTRRLSREIDGLGTPVVLLVGWPGLGKRELLVGLSRDDAGVAGVPSAMLLRTADLLRACENLRSQGVSRFVVEAAEDADWNHLASVLLPGEQLLAATNVYRASEALEAWGRVGVLLPQDFLLREVEALELAGAEGVGDVVARRLWRWSSGWLEPLRQAMRSGATDGTTAAGSVSVVRFLEERVLAPLGENVRRELAELAAFLEPLDGDGQRVERSHHDSGLTPALQSTARLRRLPWIDGGQPQLPGPLVRYLQEHAPRPASAGSGRRLAVAGVAETKARPIAVKISLLGDPAVALERGDDWTEVRFPYRLVAAVLGNVATSPDLRVSKDVLVADLWPDASASHVRGQLHPAVSKLRRLLDPERDLATPGVELINGVYRLSRQWSWTIDCVELESLVKSALGHGGAAATDSDGAQAGTGDDSRDFPAAAAEDSVGGRLSGQDLEAVIVSLESAWRLYSGPFMRGFSARWVRLKREHYERVYERLLRALASAYEVVDRWEDAEDAYRSLLINDASQEDVHVRLMKLYARRGRLDLARRQWERLCKVLLDELGVPPMDTTLREYRRLLG